MRFFLCVETLAPAEGDDLIQEALGRRPEGLGAAPFGGGVGHVGRQGAQGLGQQAAGTVLEVVAGGVVRLGEQQAVEFGRPH